MKITVYGTIWCGDCYRTRKYLDKNGIPYEWVNIDHNKDAEAFVIKVNHGNRSVPTLIFENGAILVEPTNQELAKMLGIGLPGDLSATDQ